MMPSETDKQRRFFGAVMNYKQHGGKASKKVKEAANSMTYQQIRDFMHVRKHAS